MQFINFSDDATLPRLCKWQFLCQLCSVQLAYSADAMWFQSICAFWKRERAVIHSRYLWNYVSQKVLKLLYKFFNEEIWIVQHYNFHPRQTETETVPLHVVPNLSRQTCHQLEIVFLRSAFLETADQTSQRHYRPMVICSRSIGAPLFFSKNLHNQECHLWVT